MSEPRPGPDPEWGPDGADLRAVARNVSTRYLAIGVDAAIGLVLLPFNVAHLGQAAYGLWMLTASITTYMSVLDLGYAGSLVRFVAHYRAVRDARGLNQTLSTLFFVFAGIGLLAYAAAFVLAMNAGAVFRLAPGQAGPARDLLLIIGLYVALGFPFSVFGGVINGFQRFALNNVVGIVSSVMVAAVNVGMLWAGRSLVELVAATTAVRVLTFAVYRANAYRVFPALRLRPSLFRAARLKEVTGFSIYMQVIDWANKLNYQVDPLIIGAVLGSPAVAIWTVPQRLAEVVQRLTNQMNGVLFPLVVDSAATDRADRLRLVFLEGTRLSLATVLPVAAVLMLLGRPLIHAWVGPGFDAAVQVLPILAAVVAVRVGNATATTVLKGGGQHRLLAAVNGGGAVVNLALSLLLIQRYGLVGQAMGTLAPLTATSALILFPLACRRVGVRPLHAFRYAIWPAVWPLAGPVLAALVLRRSFETSLVAVFAVAVAAASIYYATFLGLAVGSAARRRYLTKAAELVGLGRRYPQAA